MFGGELVAPKCHRRTKPKTTTHDIQLPSVTPAYYQHIAREPHTNDHVQLLHYKQRKNDFALQRSLNESKRIKNDATFVKYDKHAEKLYFQRQVKERVREKMQRHEQAVEERRKKLQKLLCEEEKQFFHETVDQAQKGDEKRLEEMKSRVEILRANREAERMEIVRQKRIEQYKDRCSELRPVIYNKNLIDSKKSQLQQMRENQARRESEKELDLMWHLVTLKDVEAKKEREVQEMLKRDQGKAELLETWEKQKFGKDLLKVEVERGAQEDRIEMDKLKEQLRREEIEELDGKRRKRDQIAAELREQIAKKDILLAQRQKEEQALDNAFAFLTRKEVEQEGAKVQSFTMQAKREADLVRYHLKELEVQRKQEEVELNALLEVHRKAVEGKQDEARCKLVEAKRQLQKDVLEGRAQQLAYKKLEAEQQLKLKEAENELIRMTYETNERLEAEHQRMQHEAVKQYKSDLQQQIEYNQFLKEREQQILERQLCRGLEEEEKFRKIVQDMLQLDVEVGEKHPFRKLLETPNCRCPPLN